MSNVVPSGVASVNLALLFHPENAARPARPGGLSRCDGPSH